MEEFRDYNYTQFISFFEEQLHGIRDFELLILKSHIVAEYILNCYLEILSVNDKANFFKENFSFDTKLKILKHFGSIFDDDDELIRALKTLNKIRNGIAHTLKINEKLMQEFSNNIIQLSSDDKLFKEKETLHDKFLFGTGYLCGVLFDNYEKIRGSQN